jgi:excisionase family DNA binding protein
MEKICLARRRWEGGKAGDRVSDSSAALRLQPEPLVTIEPGDLARSLASYLITMGNQDLSDPTPITKKFELEARYDSFPPVKISVYIKPAGDQTDKRWLTVKEAAETFKVGRATIYKGLRAGWLSGLRIGRQWRVIMPDYQTGSRRD